MDLSSYGKTREFRRKLVEMSPVMIGTVPVYDAVGFMKKTLKILALKNFSKWWKSMPKTVWTL